MISGSWQAYRSLYNLVLGNFDSIRDRHVVFLFPCLLLVHSSVLGLQSHAPRSAGMFLDVLSITMTLSLSELAALGHVHCFPPDLPSSFWLIVITG